MLGLMRQLMQSKASGIIFGLIILSMAAFGIENIFSAGIGADFVRSGGRSVDQATFDRRLETYIRTTQERLGRGVSRREAAEQGVLEQILTQETGRVATLGYANGLEANASPLAVFRQVRSIDAFQSGLTGEFDTDAYRQALSRAGLSREAYEQDVRDGLTLDYLQGAAAAAVQAPKALTDLQALFAGEARAIAWTAIEASQLPALPEATEDALRAVYNERIALFEEPERRAISVLELSKDDFLHLAEVTEEDIADLYEIERTRRFAEPETRVFVEARFPTEAAAQTGLGQLAAGVDPSAVPGALSVETRTARRDAVANAAFGDALFSPFQTVGSVLGPIDAGGAWLVGRVEEVRPGDPLPLEAVREEIVDELRSNAAQAAYLEADDELDALIGAGLDIDEIGGRLGVPVLSFAPMDARGVTADGTVLGGFRGAQEALAMAFDLFEGEVSERIDLADATLAVSVDRIIPARTPEFEEIRDRVAETDRALRRRDALDAAVEAARAEIAGGEATIAAVAERFGAEVRRPAATVQRGQPPADDTPRSVLAAAFQGGVGSATTAQGRSAEEAIIVVVERIDRPGPETVAALAPAAAAQTANQLSEDLLLTLQAKIQETVEIETNDAAFAAYKARVLDQP